MSFDMLKSNLAIDFVKQNVQLVSDSEVLVLLLAFGVLLRWRVVLEEVNSVLGVCVEEQPLNVLPLPQDCDSRLIDCHHFG